MQKFFDTLPLAILNSSAYEQTDILPGQLSHESMYGDIVGASAGLRKITSVVEKVAPTDTTILITGETGTGKELVAQAIHRASARSSRALIKVNCAALPVELIASELFGHEKGAFTGALNQRIGRFEAANGGTIFLDEIGEFKQEIQVSLLRVLQEREFERLGGNRSLRTDVRVIAATNKDLQQEVWSGRFRSDLYYRLNVFPIHVPPLRERPDDIMILTAYFVARLASRMGKRIRRLEKRTLDAMLQYSWPGNIRELQNVIERGLILTDGDVFRLQPGSLQRGSNESSNARIYRSRNLESPNSDSSLHAC